MKKQDLISRWSEPEGLQHLDAIRHHMSRRRLRRTDELPAGFGTIEGLKDWRGIPLADFKEIAKREFTSIDLSYASLQQMWIEQSLFGQCRFHHSDLLNVRDRGNTFKECLFHRADLRHTRLGGVRSEYQSSVFDHCKFQGASFEAARFTDCAFNYCKLDGLDFFGSSFRRVSFSGKLTETWFRGQFPTEQDVRKYGPVEKNTMEGVSFRDAELCWVTFTNDCDLSGIEMPTKGEYLRLSNWTQVLKAIEFEAASWTPEVATGALEFCKAYSIHADKQKWGIVNIDDIRGFWGDEVASRIAEVIRRHPQCVR